VGWSSTEGLPFLFFFDYKQTLDAKYIVKV